MYQITINDPSVYKAGEAFARANHSPLEEMVNKYVTSLAAKATSRARKGDCITDTKEFMDAMEYMDTLVADDLDTPVSADEDGNGAIARIKYGL